MKILIVGSRGLLGQALQNVAKNIKNIEIITSDISDEGGIDISSEESIEAYMYRYRPDAVFNCAAYTNVDNCETEDGYQIALQVNGYGPGKLAKFSKKYEAKFVHISTDYVFGDNKKSGYDEDYYKFLPLNKYGQSKLLGEKEVIKVYDGVQGSDFVDQSTKAYIVRTSWLFGHGATNFIAKILQYAKEREFLQVVTDEVSSPTYVNDLAKWMLSLVTEDKKAGIYHISGQGRCSRFDFAKKILEIKGIKTEIRPTTLDKFDRKTQIANFSYLNNNKLVGIRSWEEMLEDYLTKI